MSVDGVGADGVGIGSLEGVLGGADVGGLAVDIAGGVGAGSTMTTRGLVSPVSSTATMRAPVTSTNPIVPMTVMTMSLERDHPLSMRTLMGEVAASASSASTTL
ncbi:hypothetical protein ACRCUN_22750 [Mycobacterium sp. LTG2003]